MLQMRRTCAGGTARLLITPELRSNPYSDVAGVTICTYCLSTIEDTSFPMPTGRIGLARDTSSSSEEEGSLDGTHDSNELVAPNYSLVERDRFSLNVVSRASAIL